MVLGFLKRFVWHMPDGFATIVGGIFVLIAAGFAFVGVNRQIRTQLDTDERRFRRERDALRFALYSELMMYVQPVLQIVSSINEHLPPNGKGQAVFIPPMVEPILFKSSHEKIGILGDTRAIMRLLSFHVNLMNITASLKPDANNFVFPHVVAPAFQLIVLNLREALTLLGPSQDLPLPFELDAKRYVYWDGKKAEQLDILPTSIQQMLWRMGGGRGDENSLG
jgi:hypothetical protein